MAQVTWESLYPLILNGPEQTHNQREAPIVVDERNDSSIRADS